MHKGKIPPPVHGIPVMANVKNSGDTTARRAGSILVAKELGFVLPTGKQKKNLVVAFVKRDKIVYGKAFDIIKLQGELIWTV